MQEGITLLDSTKLLAGARIKLTSIKGDGYSVLKKSPKENHVILKELSYTGLETNETLAFQYQRA